MANTQFDDCTVLILDDQSTSRTILSHVVRSINPNIKVVEKTNPELALEWATQHTAELVFVDYVMPEMNGIDFVWHSRRTDLAFHNFLLKITQRDIPPKVTVHID